MTMQDPISDLLTRIRNAQMAGHTSVLAPNSKIKRSILSVLADEGYIEGFDATDYSGAVDPNGEDWTAASWINYSP